MNNIGRIIFGCIAAAIIVVAIILLIPFGMSAEDAQKALDSTAANIEAKSETATYLEMEDEYYTIYLYNEKTLGNAEGDVIGRIDFKKAIPQESASTYSSSDSIASLGGGFKSGSVIIGKMKIDDDSDAKWCVIKTATSGAEGDTKWYKSFDTQNEAESYIQTEIPQAGMLLSYLNKNLANIMGSVTQLDTDETVVGGSKAIAGAITVAVENSDKTLTKDYQISNDLIKKVTIKQTDGEKTVTETYSFKYSGALQMVKSLIDGLSEHNIERNV